MSFINRPNHWVTSAMAFMSWLLILLLLIGGTACGLNTEEEGEDKVKEANLYLSSSNCSKAQEALSDYPGETDDFHYIQTLASVYACQASFSELTFFSTEIDKLTGTETFPALASFDMAQETEVDSTSYENLQTALNTIIFVRGSSLSTSADRSALYGAVKNNELNLQILYMLMTYIGKWLNFHGNTNSSGLKGGGPRDNDCVFPYSNAVAQAYVDSEETGSCAGPYNGSSALDVAVVGAELAHERVCELIVGVNHLIDILGNVSISGNDSNGGLGDVSAAIGTLLSGATTLDSGISNLLNLYNVTDCTSYVAAGSNFDIVEAYFAAFIETSL